MKSSEFILSNRVAELTPAQIGRIFESIIDHNIILEADIPPQAAQQVKQAANSTLQKLMSMPAAAVQDFDAKIDQLEKQVATKFGPQSQVMQYITRYREWAKKHPVTQTVILAALSVVIALCADKIGVGIVITSVAVGFLKLVDELVLGKKASEAFKQAGKAALIAGAIGSFVDLANGTELVKSAEHWIGEVGAEVGPKAAAATGAGAGGIASVARGAASVAGDAVKGLKNIAGGGGYY